jgi:hypothetical protein
MFPSERDSQLEIFQALLCGLTKRGVGRGATELAIQLTSLICSPQTSIATKTLNPSPEAIRKKVESQSHKKQQS